MEELKRLRKARGLSQAKLAALADLDPSTVSQIETGTRHANTRTLERLAEALGAEVVDLFPKDLSPRLPLEERGERSWQALEQALARVLEPVRAEALKEQQAGARALSSEGLDHATRIVDPPEAEAGKRFVDEFSLDEIPVAFGEVALGYARFEQEKTNLQQALTQGRKLLRERDQKIARLEEENAQLRKEHEQAKVEKT